MLTLQKFSIHEQSTNQPTMKTEACRARSLKAGKQFDERHLATRMTRSLSGVPFEYRSLYEVRGERKRLMGTFPEIAVGLAKLGAPPADVLYPVEAVEREVMKAYGETVKASLADLQHEETDATHRLDVAQLDLAAHPHDKAIVAEALDAAYGQKIATDLLTAKLTEMEAAL